MKFLVGRERSQQSPLSVYLVDGEQAFNLSAADPSVGSDLRGLMAQNALSTRVAALTALAQSVPLEAIAPKLPIAQPGKTICLGLNYKDHIKEGGYSVPEYPALFMRGANSLLAAGQPIIRPQCSHKLDYEAELMIIVGRRGRHISEAQALSYVFAYTTFNDGSVRDYQRKTHQWTPGKNFDATGAVGPFAVTPDELPEGAVGLKIQTRVGDEILQNANTSDMLWSVARIISTISEYATLEAGDLIAMGTPPGVGHARTPPRWLVPGEVVEVEIEGIGICANPIADEDRID